MPLGFKIISKPNSNTKMSNYKFITNPSKNVLEMVQLTTQQRVFIVANYRLTQSVTEEPLICETVEKPLICETVLLSSIVAINDLDK